MEEQGLKIVVSADVRNALLNLTELTDATGELAVEGVGNITSVNSALTSLRQAQKEAGDPAQLQVLNRAIKDLSAESSRLRSVGVSGFDEFGNKIKKAGDEAVKASGGIAGFASNAFSSLRKIAYILPGVGVAGLIGAISSGIVELFTNSSKAAKEAAEVNKQYFATFQKVAPLDTESAKNQIKEYTKIVDESVQSTGKEAAQVEILVNRLQQGNTTRKQSTEIIKELQKIAPDYFSKLNAEKASIDEVTAAYQKYNQVLVQNIEAQIHIAEITETVKKRLDFSRQTPDAAKFINDQLAAGKSLDDISKQITDEYRKGLDLSGQAALANKANAAQLEKQALLTAKIPFGVQTIIKYLRDEQDLLKQISNAPLKLEGVDDKSTKGIDQLEKEIQALEQAKSALKALTPSGQRPLSAIQEQLDHVDTKLLEDKITKALRDGAKNGLSKDVIAVQVSALQQELDKIGQIKPAHVRGIVDVQADSVTNIESKIEKSLKASQIKLTVPATIGIDLKNSNYTKEEQSILKDALEDDAKLLRPTLVFRPDIQVLLNKKTIALQMAKQLQGSIAEFSKSLQEQLAVDVGKSIGSALTGNSIKSAINEFLSFLGDGLEKIGEKLIVTAGIFHAIQLSLGSLLENPALALAAGIAAVAAGEAIKASVHATKFATGGIITGPTVGLIGEAGPEVVFPLNQLNRFVKNTQGNGGQNINVTGAISGNNIRLALARTSKLQGLV